MTESIILSAIVWFLAVLLARFLIRYFQSIVDVNIAILYQNASSIAGFFLSIIIIGIIFGLHPAIMISSFNPFTTGMAVNLNSPNQGKLKNAFVLFQFILSISLIIASFIVIKQTRFLKNMELNI